MATTVGLDHLTLTVADLGRAQQFYDAALAPLGWRRLVDYLDPEDEDEAGVEAVGYGGSDGSVLLWIVVGDVATTGLHLSLRAPDADAVRAFFAAATSAGATPHQSPRRWQIYRPGTFTATVGDEHGNLVEATAVEGTQSAGRSSGSAPASPMSV